MLIYLFTNSKIYYLLFDALKHINTATNSNNLQIDKVQLAIVKHFRWFMTLVMIKPIVCKAVIKVNMALLKKLK